MFGQVRLERNSRQASPSTIRRSDRNYFAASVRIFVNFFVEVRVRAVIVKISKSTVRGVAALLYWSVCGYVRVGMNWPYRRILQTVPVKAWRGGGRPRHYGDQHKKV